MPSAAPRILVVNGGSSSIRFAVFRVGAAPERELHGMIDRIGISGTSLGFEDPERHQQGSRNLSSGDQQSVVDFLIDWLDERDGLTALLGAGHRVVHGMRHSEPELVTRELLTELHELVLVDPDHLPREIELIEAIRRRRPELPQIACFDTAFHARMPRVATLLPIPRRYAAQGVRRYGFHGLSYAWLMEELERLGDPAASQGRVILAHLGHGASLAAVLNGHSVDTSMGFTPASGLVMSTRSGDLDPGLAPYLARVGPLTAAQFGDMVNHESGLLGVSELSADMHDLLAREGADVRAAEAVALFCYQAKKWIGSFAAVLGGLDALVFSGGIGEHASLVRARICDGLGFLGIALDPERNARHAPLISPDGERVRVRVIPTNEELMLARTVCRILDPDVASRA